MALPRTNRIITIKRLDNVSWKKSYWTTVTTWLNVRIYPSDWYEDYFATQEVEGWMQRWKMITEFLDVQANDLIIDDNWKEYKIHKADLKDSAWLRPSFYQCLLVENDWS